MKKIAGIAVILAIACGPAVCAHASRDAYHGKKVLYVNSYHKGYDWSDNEQQGAERVFAGTGVELRELYMDTKNNPSEIFCKEAGRKVKAYIEEFQPDVLITADDNAFAYVVTPYFRDAALPVVFCGINWDISPYAAPYKNTTGMIEVALIGQLYDHLRNFAKGGRVGFIGFDSVPERRNTEYYEQYLRGQQLQKVFVKDFASWKKEFLALQDKVDAIMFGAYPGIQDWDESAAEKFVLEHVRVPTGSDMECMAPHFLIGLIKYPQEQGEYAAQTALRILDGEKPADIPVVTNKKGALYLNTKVAGKLDVIFTPSLFKNAKVVLGLEE